MGWVHRAGFGVYSVRKVWKAVGRLGIEAGRDRAARIIKCVDLQAATRIRRVRTLSPASAAAGSGSLIDARAPAADDAVATKRMMALVASVLILTIPAHDILAVVGGAPMASSLGGDFLVYRDAAARWASGGGFYWLWQLNVMKKGLRGENVGFSAEPHTRRPMHVVRRIGPVAPEA